MGIIIILITTLLVISIMIIRSIRSNRKIKSSLEAIIKSVNSTYINLFKEGKFLRRILLCTMIISAEALAFVSIFTTINRSVEITGNNSVDWIIKLSMIALLIVIIHYGIGYVLYISNKIHMFIYKVEDKNLKLDFILSYFIISTFLAVLLVFPKQFKEVASIALVPLIICYCLNLRVLFTLMIKPDNVKSTKEESTSFSRILMASILLLFMLVLNLFLGACVVNALTPEAYTNVNSNFDLFYYTIITFTTIGYGDIAPLTIMGKVLAIIISITSVICLTVFISSILSYKDNI